MMMLEINIHYQNSYDMFWIRAFLPFNEIFLLFCRYFVIRKSVILFNTHINANFQSFIHWIILKIYFSFLRKL